MTDRYHFYFCFTDEDSASGKLINLSVAVQVIWGSQGLNCVVWLWSHLAYCCQMPLVCGIFHTACIVLLPLFYSQLHSTTQDEPQ